MLYFYLWLSTQIILESLPISSSGHLILLERIYQWMGHDLWQNFSWSMDHRTFYHFAHGPTVIIIALFFFKEWFFLITHLKRCWHIIGKIVLYIFIADGITALWYIALRHYIPVGFPLPFGFAITAATLFSLSWCPQRRGSITIYSAAILGCAQGVALLPGISRLATTYTVGRWCGLSARKSFAVSWLISWPLITAAWLESLITITFDGSWLQLLNTVLLLVMLSASIGAWYALKITQSLMYNNKLSWVGWYMMAPLALSLIV